MALTTIQAGMLSSGVPTRAQMPAGSVLQVAQTVLSTAFTSTTKGSYVAVTGLSVDLTPISITSKVLVTVNVTTSNLNNLVCYFHIYRNGVQITPNGVATGTTPATAFAILGGGSASNAAVSATIPMTFLDSPVSTSTQTYQVYAAVNSTAILNLNVNPATTNGGGAAGGSSTITLMEIAA